MNTQKRRIWLSIRGKFVIGIDLFGKEDLSEMFKGKYIYSTIPCYSYHEENPALNEQGNIQIECTEQGSNSVNFDLEKNRIYLSVTPERLYEGDIVYLVYLLLTKILQEEGYFLVHGSCIAYNRKTILLVGPSESGKTIVSLTLCLKHKFSLVSSDMSLLKREGNKITTIGGTKECSVYPGTIKAVFGEEGRKLFSKFCNGLWEEKIDITEAQLKEFGIDYEQNIPLDAIYYLRVQDSVFFAKPLNEVASKIKALGLLSEWIRGANNLVISTNSLVPSFDTVKAEKERLLALSAISESVLQYSLYGNLHEVAKFIVGQSK